MEYTRLLYIALFEGMRVFKRFVAYTHPSCVITAKTFLTGKIVLSHNPHHYIVNFFANQLIYTQPTHEIHAQRRSVQRASNQSFRGVQMSSVFAYVLALSHLCAYSRRCKRPNAHWCVHRLWSRQFKAILSPALTQKPSFSEWIATLTGHVAGPKPRGRSRMRIPYKRMLKSERKCTCMRDKVHILHKTKPSKRIHIVLKRLDKLPPPSLTRGVDSVFQSRCE
jgi:hypothetical protein